MILSLGTCPPPHHAPHTPPLTHDDLVCSPQLQGAEESVKLSEKYPSFELVLNFVKNDAVSVDMVHSILQRRSRLASNVAQAYTFASEYLRTMDSHVFEVRVWGGWEGEMFSRSDTCSHGII